MLIYNIIGYPNLTIFFSQFCKIRINFYLCCTIDKSDKNRKISPVGNEIWQSVTAKQANVVKQYLDKTLNHYSRVQQGSADSVDHIISAYRSKA